MPYGTSQRGIQGGGGGGAYQSLDIEESLNSYLSMSNANFIAGGDYDHAKFAIIGSFKLESTGQNYLYSKHVSSSADSEFALFIGGTDKLALSIFDGSGSATFACSTTINTGTWYAFMFHVDTANATSTDRIKCWINNSSETASSYTAPTAPVVTTTAPVYIGILNPSLPNNFDGLAHKMSLVSGVLPSPSSVFSGTSGRLKDIAKLSGIHSLLDVRGGDVTSDRVLAASWTNNNGVVASTETP